MMTFRGMLFWAMDTLRGGPVRKHLKEIKVILEDDSDDSRRDKLLSTQLSYVTSSVPYYRDLHGTLDLAKFPVVNKTIIRENQNLMIADNFEVVDEFMDDFRAIVGSQANVEIEYTDETFELSSGKRQSVISYYQPVAKGIES